MRKIIILSIISMGASSLISQVILLRELLITFLGNELSIGIILANWVILGALGSGFMARMLLKNNSSPQTFALLQILNALYMPLAVILSRLPQKILHIPQGESIGLWNCFIFSFLILAPVAISSGMLFFCAAGICSGSGAPHPRARGSFIFPAKFTSPVHSTYSAQGFFRRPPRGTPAFHASAPHPAGLRCKRGILKVIPLQNKEYSGIPSSGKPEGFCAEGTKQRTDKLSPGKIYGLEALGAFAAGILITIWLIPKLSSMGIAFVVSLINSGSAWLILYFSPTRRILKTSLPLALILIILAGFVTGLPEKLNNMSLNKQWAPLELIESKNSPYGNIALLKKDNQWTIFVNGTPLASLPYPDISAQEDLVHFAMLAHPLPKDILIISSACAGVIQETLKHPSVRTIDYLELDPDIIKAYKKIPSETVASELTDPRVNVINTDAIEFMREKNKKYDIIILNTPAPCTLEINRFYTREFFKKTDERLNTNGILVFKAPGTSSAYNSFVLRLNSCLKGTALRVFRHSIIIPGETNIFLSSNDRIQEETIPDNFRGRNLETKNISLPYIKYSLLDERRQWLERSLKQAGKTPDNRDFKPKALYYCLQMTNAKISPAVSWILQRPVGVSLATLIIILAYLTVSLRKRNPKNAASFAVFSSAAASMSLCIIIILSYQILIGFLYTKIGLLLAAFMLGIFLGTYFPKKRLRPYGILILADSTFIIFLIFLIPALAMVQAEHIAVNDASFFILSIICGIWVGVQFPAASAVLDMNNASADNDPKAGNGGPMAPSWLYALELCACAAASVLTPIFLIPLLGVTLTVASVLILKACSLGLLLASRPAQA